MCESVYKVLIIGDPQVGKTSMVARYCYRDWMPNYKATVGADYAVKTIKWSTTETVRLHIWDLAGQDHYRAMTRTYYKGASGCLVVYDITNRGSFEQAKAWKQDLDQKVYLPNCEQLPCILVANKDDLSDRAVTDHEMNKFVKENGFLCWESMSVKLNRNVSETFCKLVERMLAQEHELSSAEVATLTAAAVGNTAAAGSPISVTNYDPPRPQDKGNCCSLN